jgi:hypothetical protein
LNYTTLPYENAQCEKFRSGELREQWAEKYKNNLFDDQVISNAHNQNSRHFWEWLAAILIYHVYGFHYYIDERWRHL